MQEQDEFRYFPSHWNLNALWQGHYNDIIRAFSAMEEIEKYRPAANNNALADQYIAECRVIRAYLYLNIARSNR